jgi:hypothetical protein
MMIGARLGVPGILVLSLVAASGCSSSVAAVKGMVSVDGKPANDGMVIFSAGDRSGSGAIRPDGTYDAPEVPIGEVTVAIFQMVMSEEGKNAAPKGGGPLAGMENLPKADIAVADAVPIPPKYRDIKTSGLTYTVKRGGNEINIELSTK